MTTARKNIKPSAAWCFVALFIVLLFDPGIMSNDSITQLQQARTLELNDWHPPIMALIWHVLDKLIPGSAGMLLAQGILYSYACARLCAYAFPSLSKRSPRWFLPIVFSLFPPTMTLTGMIWKDVWMGGFLALALSFLFSLSVANTQKERILHFSALSLCCLLATAFRHNGLAATAGLLAGGLYLVLVPRRWYSILSVCAAGVLLALVFGAVVTLSYRLIAKPGHVTTPLFLFDIAGIIVRSPSPTTAARLALDAPVKLTNHPDQFLTQIQQQYSPMAATNLLTSSRRKNTAFDQIYPFDDQHDAEGIKQLWKSMVSRYPLAYLTHRARVLSCLMQLCNREEWRFRSYILNPTYVFPKDLSVERVQFLLRRLFLSPSTDLLYQPATWFLLTLVGGILGLRPKAHTRDRLLVFMALSSLGLVVSLFFATPIESYRYIYWTVFVGWTMIFLGLEKISSRIRPIPSARHPETSPKSLYQSAVANE